MTKNKRNQKRKGNSDQTLSILSASHPGAGRGDLVTVSSDLRSSVRNWNLTQNPPKNFLTMIHWVQSTIKTAFNTNNTGAVVELNQNFSLATNINNYTSYAAVFDQYCIHSASVRVMSSLAGASASLIFGRLITAIDYDNTTPLTSEAVLLQYGTANSTEIIPGKSYQRVVKPACAPAVFSAGAFSGYGVSRAWLNSTTAAVPHYGVRLMVVGSANTSTLDVEVTVIAGFRNNL